MEVVARVIPFRWGLYGLVGFHADSMEHHNRTNSYTVNYLNANMNINGSIRVYNIANSYCKFLGMFRHNMGMDQYLYIPFLGMNIQLPAILMFTRGIEF